MAHSINFSINIFNVIKLLVIILSIPILLILLIISPLYVGNHTIKPDLLFSKNSTLERMQMDDYCDPLPCGNIYLILTNKNILNKDFHYCQYAQIGGNIFIGDKTRNPLDYFGSDKYCYLKHLQSLTCLKNNLLIKYKIISLLPFPKIVPVDFYSCGDN